MAGHSAGRFGCVDSQHADNNPVPFIILILPMTALSSHNSEVAEPGFRPTPRASKIHHSYTVPSSKGPAWVRHGASPQPPAVGGWGQHTNPLSRTASPMWQAGPRLVLLPTRRSLHSSRSQAGKQILPTLKFCLLCQMEPSLFELFNYSIQLGSVFPLSPKNSSDEV